jgi:hypothetical protein
MKWSCPLWRSSPDPHIMGFFSVFFFAFVSDGHISFVLFWALEPSRGASRIIPTRGSATFLDTRD